MWKIMTIFICLFVISGFNQNYLIHSLSSPLEFHYQDNLRVFGSLKTTNLFNIEKSSNHTTKPNILPIKLQGILNYNKASVLLTKAVLRTKEIINIISLFYNYGTKLHLLKNKLGFNSKIYKIPNVKSQTNLNSLATTFKLNKTESFYMPVITEDKQKIARFRIIFYTLLITLAIVSSFLILVYLKRNSNLKYTRELEEKNRFIQLQNVAFVEQTKHLENANTVKDKLFGIISHDLKDSITSINGLIDLLKDGSLTREEFYAVIPDLSETANNACLLLFNLLHWSKSQMNALKPKPEVFNIQEVIKEKFNLFKQRTNDKGITIMDKSQADFVYADRSMLEIVIQNLLANALKFSKAGDSITISSISNKDVSVVSVADTGVGISKENIEKLFKNDYFTTRGTNNEKGTGLGLPICKELLELNKGKIRVESTENVGTTFYIELPKHEPSS